MLSEIEAVPVYKLRPPEGCTARSRCTYLALDDPDGEFFPDDGKPHLAFVCTIDSFAFMVDLPDYFPLGWHWSELVDGRRVHHRTTLDLHYVDNRDHPNERAGQRAMDHVVKRDHVANGRPLKVYDPSHHGWRLRGHCLYDFSGHLTVAPDSRQLVCALCTIQGHELLDLAKEAGDYAAAISVARDEMRKAQQRIWDLQSEIDRSWRWLREHRAEVHEARQFERRVG